MRLFPGTRIGPYEVRPLEGRGRTAAVYRALDTRLGREVALKIVDFGESDSGKRKAFTRLEHEARILASLEHPNIARVHGLEQIDGMRALVMELIEGPTLADRVATGPMDVPEALDIARHVAAALEAAHDCGVIHRDLKPANIKLSFDGVVKVLDFGLARIIRPSSGRHDSLPTITSDGVAAGTAAYMSPEQARGRGVDERTDIWAFGCVVYEMLTGRRAFDGEDTASTFASVLGSEPDWELVPAALPATALVFLQRCLSKQPIDRPRHIGDVRLALEGKFDAPRGARTPSDGAAQSPARGVGLRLPAALVIAALLGGAGGLSLTRLRRGGDAAKSYVIHAPPGTRFDDVTMEPFPAVSPDGQYVVYRASDSAAASMWLQRLGDMTARELADSEGAGRPFWSPDGRAIGFAGPTGLRTIAMTGGSAPQNVCTCPVNGGATWAADGTILYAREGGLSRIAATGGSVTTVTSIAGERGEFAHQHPLFLPDGRRFLYLVRSLQPEHRGIYLASLDDPGRARRLLPDDSSVNYGIGPDDRTYLFFVRDVTLVAQPFDVNTGALTGSPLVIAPRIVPGEGGRFAPFASGGRSVVFRQTTAPHNRLRWLDRRGVPQPDAGVIVGSFRHLTLAPDGRRIVVSRHDLETTKLDLWIHDLERGVSERVTWDPIGAFFPVWTPDGDRLIYASAREGPWHLFWRASTRPDSGRIYAAPLPFTKYPTDVMPDGRHLLFQGDGAIWVLPLTADGSVPARVVSGIQGRVSPDGRWLAFTSAESGRREVYVTAFAEPKARWRVSTEGGEDPLWRSDGRELFFISTDRTMVAAAVTLTPQFTAQNQRLFRASIDERTLRFGPSYAADRKGERFLIIERDDRAEVVLTAMEHWASSGR